ncbi:hypothetical protein Ait01nite_089230 [Actinoplanes italicus]|uniref:Uncharacterized protein n=1 Tax=Actinoplanes italicus TaxID=113567 RepID=A0A2T0JIM8_9ACTN|nr:hypothetical protein [Actinoplanes italicus]PRX07339.1 hypothetical protein CLV67_14214 [Actinoplanes italicus]GIE35878.1 hypothetical protein Ait01nite_089230 [Actinoplanes italicus]
MTVLRHYPPGVVLHTSSCPDITGHSAPSLQVLQAVLKYPSYRYCMCTGGGPETAPYVVVERIDYGDHLYIPKPGNPPRDAVRALCRTCRGTHGPAQQDDLGSGFVVAKPGQRR